MADDDGTNTLLIIVAVLVGIPVMLGIFVIGAAVIGSFVLGFGGGAEGAAEAPSVQWESTDDADAGAVTFTHQGGEEVLEGDVLVTVNGETA
jgi:FlaG/FlaF family flagellin (archaellin)